MLDRQIYPIGGHPVAGRRGDGGPSVDLGRRRFGDILKPFDG